MQILRLGIYFQIVIEFWESCTFGVPDGCKNQHEQHDRVYVQHKVYIQREAFRAHRPSSVINQNI